MLVLMIERQCEAVVHFRILRAHALSGTFRGTHHLECFRTYQFLLLNGTPCTVKVTDGAAVTQIGVVGHTILLSRHIALPELTIGMREAADKREVVAVGRRLRRG